MGAVDERSPRLARSELTARASSLRVGIIFPADEVHASTSEIVNWARSAESAGYKHLAVPDHVLAADPALEQAGWDAQWPGHREGASAYTTDQQFREPLILLAYLAGQVTVELVTGLLVLPQRQTALVAKQAAEIDRLSEGRLRLAVGVGWNPIEYEALGSAFHSRGRVLDEQFDVLRRLWTTAHVSYQGSFHKFPSAGIQGLPVQRPIPLWIGGHSDAAMRRAGRLSDGWFVMRDVRPGAEFDRSWDVIRAAATEAGRDLSGFGIEGRLPVGRKSDAQILDEYQAWSDAGVTHVCIDTRFGGRRLMSEHIEALQRVGGILGL